MLDPLPKLLTDLRDDETVAAITTLIRGYEPAAGDAHAGSSTDPYVAFVVLVRLDSVRAARGFLQRPRIAARCYGRTRQEAFQLAAAVSDAVHNAGPRTHDSGIAFYQSLDDSGPSQDTDPVTQQPLETLVIDLIATAQAIA